MKYFICALDNNPTGSLGIPAESIERIVPAEREQSTVCDTENEENFISLPMLLKLKNNAAPHGLVLKTNGIKKVMLLCPKIDIELEIPEEDIHSLPEALSESLGFFKGAYFTNQKVILIIDPGKLMESIVI